MTTVRNWKKFQHYKHRDPPWIRLYRSLLNDREWHNLDGEAAKGLVMIWLIVSESEGQLPPAQDLAFRLRMTEAKTVQLLSKLSHWLEQDASAMLADRYQDAPTETETETETEIELKRADARGRYAFIGSIIKLNQKHFDNWTQCFPNLDLRGELTARDAWLAGRATDNDRESWFISTSKYLANRNLEAKSKIAAARPGKTMSGMEGVS